MSLKRVLSDRTEFRHEDNVLVEEYLTIECEKCGQLTDFIVTSPDRTYYCHEFTVAGEKLQVCVIERGQNFIPDALLYAQEVRGDHNRVLVSTAEACW